MTTENDEKTYGSGSIDDVAAGLLAGSLPNEPEVEEDDGETETEATAAAADEAEEGSLPDDGEDGYDDGQDEADGEDDGQTEEPQQTYRVKVDGVEVEATLDDLTRSYAGQGYIQKRMQEVAAIRKEAETVYTALNQERAELAQALATYQQQMSLVGTPQPPSKELLSSDPIAYLEQEVAYREAVEQQQALQHHQQALLAQQAETNAVAQKAYLAAQAQELVARIPEFADAEKAGKIAGKLAQAGEAYGYSMDDLKAVSDARALNVLYDAMRYRQLMSQKGQIAAKTEGARPFVKPGAKRTETDGKKAARQNARSRMKQTGSVDDVANFLIS